MDWERQHLAGVFSLEFKLWSNSINSVAIALHGVFKLRGSALECADMSALWNWETCLPVGKRRPVAALQNVAETAGPLSEMTAGFPGNAGWFRAF